MQVILTMVFVKETRWMATLEELRGQLDVVDDREFDTLKCKKVPQSLEIGLFFCQIFIFIV